VGRKCKVAVEEGLKVIACIGETLEQRQAGKQLDALTTQLSALAR
jgi:triosephosphate isomerase